MDRKRDELITKADSDYEVTWQDVVKASRVPSVHRTTAAKHMNKAGYNVKSRTLRTHLQLFSLCADKRFLHATRSNEFARVPE